MKEDQPSLVLQNSKLNHLISIVLKTFFISFGSVSLFIKKFFIITQALVSLKARTKPLKYFPKHPILLNVGLRRP